jgi:ribosomal protein S18 acetylase RimI-like enzyme
LTMAFKKNGADQQRNIRNLRQLPRDVIADVIGKINRIEQKTFAATEAFSLDSKTSSQRNLTVLIASCDASADVAGYAVFVNWKHELLLHKIVVIPSRRRKRPGTRMLEDVVDKARRASCRRIVLWADEANTAALSLYAQHGFSKQAVVHSYYSHGRTGVKMTVGLTG